MKDLSHLPKAAPDAGLTPDPDPKYSHLYAVGESRREDKPHAKDTPFRYSSAGECARALSYTLQGVAKEPFDLPAYTNFRLGTHIHEVVQEELGEDGYRHEVKSDIDMIVSGSLDTYCEADNEVVEYKSVGGFAFKLAIGDRSAAQGPKTPHLIQLALNVVANDAASGRLVYFAKETISNGAAKKKGWGELQRIAAEWSFTREALQPYADEEVRRLRAILELHEKGELAPRHVPYEMPPGARIVDVNKSMWQLTNPVDGSVTDTGTIWGGQKCSYCPFQTHCKEVE